MGVLPCLDYFLPPAIGCLFISLIILIFASRVLVFFFFVPYIEESSSRTSVALRITSRKKNALRILE